MKKRTNTDFINECKEIHGNNFSYEKTNFTTVNKKVIVTNQFGEDIEVWPLDFLRKYKNKNTKYSTESFIRRSKEIFGDTTYSYKNTVCNSSSDNVIITCPFHGNFIKKAYAHITSKQGCPKCNKPINNKEEFILKARETHGWKYDYSKVEYIDNKTKVCIICPKHGEFWQLPLDHIRGSNCKLCVQEKHRKTKEDFIKDSNLNKRNISIVSEFQGMSKKALFKCNVCENEWETLPNKIQNGHGCPYCNCGILTTEQFIEKAKEKHGDMYDYSKVEYVNSTTPICIICHEKDENGEEHGEFYITSTKFLTNIIPCKKCSRKSKMEHDIILILEKNNIKFIHNKYFEDLGFKSYDFYLPDYNILIECQGIQHFESKDFFGGEQQFEKQKENDIIKYNYAKNNNIKLLYFTYLECYDYFFNEKTIKTIDTLLEEIYK